MNYKRFIEIKQTAFSTILLSIMLLTSSVVGASTVTWTNSSGGSWNAGTNWSSGKAPVPVDDVVIDLIGAYTITVGADVTISSLTMDAGVLMLNTGTFVIDPSDMVLIPEGCFSMGDRFGDGYSWELPVHRVCLISFSIDKYEVTQKAYQAAIDSNPSYFKGDNLPVESVTWTEADSYCTAVGKRLPTEAEWEYAASGAQEEKYAGTSIDADIGNYAWYSVNSNSTTHLVGQKLPNGFGTYDMSGNVWEWVSDWFDPEYYSVSPVDNPQGPAYSLYLSRVLRGGSWYLSASYSRASFRGSNVPSGRYGDGGFRCARTK